MFGRNMLKLCAVGVGTFTLGTLYSRATLEEVHADSKNPRRVPLQRVLASYTSNFEPSQYWDSNWDRMEPGFEKKKRRPHRPKDETTTAEQVFGGGGGDAPEVEKPTAVRNLFLIRHGQYNLLAEVDSERILTPLGRQQAKITGQRLQKLAESYNQGKGFRYTSLIHSTMSRAVETSTIVHEFVLPDEPMNSDPMLIEGAPIPPEPPIGGWRPEPSKFFKDGARIESAFREYFHRAPLSQKSDSYDVIVCHANVIRYFVCRALQLQPEAWLRFSLHNGSITWVRINPSGNVSIRMLGCAGHMDPSMMTTT